MRKPDFCLCENKISSFKPASVTVLVGLCQTWSETPKTRFLASRLIYFVADNLSPKYMMIVYDDKNFMNEDKLYKMISKYYLSNKRCRNIVKYESKF